MRKEDPFSSSSNPELPFRSLRRQRSGVSADLVHGWFPPIDVGCLNGDEPLLDKAIHNALDCPLGHAGLRSQLRISHSHHAMLLLHAFPLKIPGKSRRRTGAWRFFWATEGLNVPKSPGGGRHIRNRLQVERGESTGSFDLLISRRRVSSCFPESFIVEKPAKAGEFHRG